MGARLGRLTFLGLLAAISAGVCAESVPRPDALLMVDQHREAIVERTIAAWPGGVTGEQAEALRKTLWGLRADQLLAISISPGIDGLLPVFSVADRTAEREKSTRIESKALGDANADLTYTPVTPCRLFDTRASQGGLGTPTVGVRRTYGAITPVASQGGTGGCAAASGAAVALIQIGTLTPSGNGLLQGGPQGAASFPNALILYQPGDQYGTAVAMPLNPANGQFDLVEQFATADLYGDLLGYFAAPVATAVDCISVASAATPIAVSSDTLVALPACSTGYTRTGSQCTGAANIPSGYLVETSASGCLYRNLSSVATFNATATATCCRIPGR